MKKLLIFLALLAGSAVPTQAQFSRITSVTLQNSNSTQAAFYTSPYTVKVGAGCTWSITGTIATLNCTGTGTSPGGATGEVQYNNTGAFGGVTGLTNGAGTNCDGFGTECKLKMVTNGTYGIVTVPTGSPAGGFTFSEFASVDGTHLSESIGAYDGALQAGVTVHTLTGVFNSPSTTSPKFIFPEAPVTACANITSPFADAICEQAAASTLTYSIIKPPGAAQGTLVGRNTASVITQGFSGDADHSNGSAGTTIGSGTSIGSTSLCSTLNCPVGTYRVNVYVDITTACGATGTYVVNLIYTDDQGSKTVPVNISGTGAVPATGVLTLSSTANFGQVSQILRSTGAASINYSTTAGACGAGGPAVGKLYLSVEPVQ